MIMTFLKTFSKCHCAFQLDFQHHVAKKLSKVELAKHSLVSLASSNLHLSLKCFQRLRLKNLNNPRTRWRIGNKDLFCIHCILTAKLVDLNAQRSQHLFQRSFSSSTAKRCSNLPCGRSLFSNSAFSATLFSNTCLQHCSTTLLYNTHLPHFCTTLVSNTALRHFSPTLLYNTCLQHCSTTLLSNTSLQHLSPTLLYDTSLQHFSTTLVSNTALRHFSPTLLYNTCLQHCSTTLLSNTSLQHLSPTLLYDTSLQHFSTTLVSNTALRHFSTRLLYDTSLQDFSTTPFSNTSLQHLSPTLLYDTSLQHFSTTLVSNTALRHFSTILLSTTSLQHFSPRLLYNTLLQHFSTTLVSNTALRHFSPTLLYNTCLQHCSTTLLYNTSLQDFSTTLLSKTSLQHPSPTLLYNTLLQHFYTTLFSNTLFQHFSTIFLYNTLLLLYNTSLQLSSPTYKKLTKCCPCHDTAICQKTTVTTSPNAAPATRKRPASIDTLPSLARATQNANAIATHVINRNKNILFVRKSTSSRSFCHILWAPHNGTATTQYRGRIWTQTNADGRKTHRGQTQPNPQTPTHKREPYVTHSGKMDPQQNGANHPGSQQNEIKVKLLAIAARLLWLSAGKLVTEGKKVPRDEMANSTIFSRLWRWIGGQSIWNCLHFGRPRWSNTE